MTSQEAPAATFEEQVQHITYFNWWEPTGSWQRGWTLSGIADLLLSLLIDRPPPGALAT